MDQVGVTEATLRVSDRTSGLSQDGSGEKG